LTLLPSFELTSGTYLILVFPGSTKPVEGQTKNKHKLRTCHVLGLKKGSMADTAKTYSHFGSLIKK